MPIVSALALAITFQNTVTPVVKEARKLAKSAEAFANKNPSRKKMYMLRGEKTWVAMRKDTDHLKDDMWREDIGVVAFAWAQNGRTAYVTFTGGSPSGDWTAGKSCTYRPNGTLAHSIYRYAAFMMNGRALEEETVYDERGQKVFSRVELEDLDGKRIQSKSEKEQMLGFRPSLKDYIRTSLLPFPR